jgi:hypothetical protein
MAVAVLGTPLMGLGWTHYEMQLRTQVAVVGLGIPGAALAVLALSLFAMQTRLLLLYPQPAHRQ